MKTKIFQKKKNLELKNLENRKPDKTKFGKYNEEKRKLSFLGFLRQVANRERILFGVVSGGTFFFLTGIFYFLYGKTFLEESLFYHLSRTDHRHNFSIYFYSIYLGVDNPPSLFFRLLAFFPQLLIQLFLANKFAKDLPFCLFVQTLAFVTFNKVITAQYFVWFLFLLPLILPSTSLTFWKKGFFCILFWVFAQLNWLFWAYHLEIEGANVFLFVWISSLLFFVTNVSILIVIIRHHRVCPVFVKGKLTSILKQD